MNFNRNNGKKQTPDNNNNNNNNNNHCHHLFLYKISLNCISMALDAH